MSSTRYSTSYSSPGNNTALFFSGIHMDMLGRLEAPALLGSSNPGTFTGMAGGASLNSASIACLLGLNCSIIGLVGDDSQGEILTRTMTRRGIKNLLSTAKGKATGSYTSIIEPDGNLVIAVADLGLNEEMTAGWLLDTHANAMADADIWFLNSNLSGEALRALSDRALPQRPKILAAASISPSKSQNLAPSLANIDVLFTNIAEAGAMLNVIAGNSYDDARLDAGECIKRLQQLGITRGSLSQGSELLWVWEEDAHCSFKPPALKKIADVTGAGDALAGVFLAGLATGKSMEQTAPLAIAAAQMTICVTGPYNEEISLDELKSRASHVRPIS